MQQNTENYFGLLRKQQKNKSDQQKHLPEKELINSDAECSYKYQIYKKNYIEGSNRLIRQYQGIAQHVENKELNKDITIFQLRQFEKGPFNQDQLPYSYEIYSEIISRLETSKTSKPPVKGQPILHPSILKIFDYYYESKIYSLYLISQRCDLPKFSEKLPFFTEAEMIAALANILEVFQYIHYNIPGKMKYFDIENCLRIKRESMEIKILDFGYSRDALAKFHGYVKQWNIYADPYSKAGTFIPGQEFYDIQGDLETKIQLFDMPAEFDNNFKEVNKQVFSKPPSFIETDHLWNAGLVLLSWFYQKFLPYDLQPKNSLKIQEELRKIRKQGIAAIDKNLKPRRQINFQWKIILDGLLMSKPPRIYSENEKNNPLIEAIFQIKDYQYSDNRLFYWKCVMKNMQNYYILYKYLKNDAEPSSDSIKIENRLQKLKYITSQSHKANLYLTKLPKIYNHYLMECMAFCKCQIKIIDILKDKKCFVFLLSKAFLSLHKISSFLSSAKKKSQKQNESEEEKNQRFFVEFKLLEEISYCEESSKIFYEQICQIIDSTSTDLRKLAPAILDKNDSESKKEKEEGKLFIEEMQKKKEMLNQIYYEQNLRKNQAQLLQHKKRSQKQNGQMQKILKLKSQKSNEEDEKIFEEFKTRSLKYHVKKQQLGILLWMELLKKFNSGFAILEDVFQKLEDQNLNSGKLCEAVQKMGQLQNYLNLVKTIQLSRNYEKFKGYLYSKLQALQ